MKAVVCQHAELTVRELPEPVPGRGQALLSVLHCGICGSDLHLRHHCDHTKALAARVGMGDNLPSSSDAVVFGHEVCGEVLAYGPGSRRRLKPGTRVVGQPVLRTADGKIVNPGLTPRANGAYAERLVMQEALLYPVPNGLSSQMAALTEPMAVGWHAIKRAGIRKKDVAIVIGCGPVGLAVICALKALGVATVVASDFSSGRRTLATQFGARRRHRPGHNLALRELGGIRLLHEPDQADGSRARDAREARPPAAAVVACVARGREDRRRAAARDLRVRRRARRGAADHRRRAPDEPRHRGRGLHADRSLRAGARGAEGDRAALRHQPHAAGVPRHAATDRPRQVQLCALAHRRGGPARRRRGVHGAQDPQAHAKILVDPRSAATEPVPVRL